MIAKYRRHRAALQLKRDQPLPLGQAQRPNITASNDTLNPSHLSIDEILPLGEERSVDQILCLQSWNNVLVFE